MSLSFDPATVVLPGGHFIGGAYVPESSGIPMHRPSDAQGYADCPVASADMVDRAVETAREALKSSGWATLAPRERTRAMHRWADLIEEQTTRLARIEALSSTRPVAHLPTGDIAVTSEQIRFFAELADKECDGVAPARDGAMGMILSEPYGVVGAITPWNFPLSMAGWKLGPALAAGNAVVLKPSEMTPWSTLILAELAVQAGIPAGLINIVLGDGPTTGNAITAHPGIGKVSFTGSTRAGQAIMANIAASGVKPVTLELGGKSPQLVFADADLDLAADCIARSILQNAGQACVAGARILVEDSVAEALSERLLERLSRVRPGATWDDQTDFSPIMSEKQIVRIEHLVSAAVAQGAEVRAGGSRIGRPGWFYAPTLLSRLAPDSPALLEEIFGPVLTLQTFHDEEEAAAMSHHPTYGLCAGLYTRDLSRTLRMVRRLEAGTVWVNRYGRSRDHILPTGGYKSSGIGKDLGREAYHANRRSKSVLIDF